MRRKVCVSISMTMTMTMTNAFLSINGPSLLPLSLITIASQTGTAMLAEQFCVRIIVGVGAVIDQSNVRRSVASPIRSSSFPATMRLRSRRELCCNFKSILISCNSNSGSSAGGRSCDAGDGDQDYVPATLLLAETLSHYRMGHQRYQEEVTWPVTCQFRPFYNQGKRPKADSRLIGQGLLHHFPSSTIFLKISCNGDFVLPIIVADYAIEKLIDAIQGEENRECPDQFQFMKNLPEKVGCKFDGEAGCQMKMVRITERDVSSYIARLYFSKPGKDDLLSVDVGPSDAINVAYRCQVPIYVHKKIVLTDAIEFSYEVERTRDAKSVFDVSLDRAIDGIETQDDMFTDEKDGPDLVAEELDLVTNINLAIKEERYIDAAMLRDKLMKLRTSKK